jgi:hypothetical protein
VIEEQQFEESDEKNGNDRGHAIETRRHGSGR